MIQQISDSELELMKIVWDEGGKALYARIMERLTGTGKGWRRILSSLCCPAWWKRGC